MTLIALYDVGAHVAMLAHGAVPAHLVVTDGCVSRADRLIIDGPSSLGEAVMIGAG